MSASEDAKRLRIRDTARADELTRRDWDPTVAAPSLVARTKTVTAYPKAAQQFYACEPITVLGAEVEGGPGTLAEESATFFALNLGTAIPPTGTNLLVTFVDGRWVFRHDG